MQYYLISFIVAIFIFAIIQYLEYNKYNNDEENVYNEPYTIYTINNCLLFVIIYVVITIIAYYVYSANIDFSFLSQKSAKQVETTAQMTGGDNDTIDPKVLSKITDNFNVGFEPYVSGSDMDSDISSISSKD
jgi:hypothetical protein